jgi:uncharacterized protein
VVGAIALLAAACWLTPVLPARAAGEAAGFQSYITPFPDNDRYRVFVFGDAFAKGVAGSLTRALAADSAADVTDVGAWGGGLARGDASSVDRILNSIPDADRFHVAVLVFGIEDVGPLKLGGKKVEMDNELWEQEYASRIDAMLKVFKKRRVAVYWLGLPIMRGPLARGNAERFNTLFRQKTSLNGFRFIDTWSAFADAAGNYAPLGPDLTGKVRQLRQDNGVHMTDRGYDRFANYVEREIRRDLIAARAEREIPLAGDATEQATIRTQAETATGAAKSGKSGASEADTPADNASVTLALATDGGGVTRKQIEINRPAIPGAVLIHLRSNRTLEVGQMLSADLQGGLTALSSITSGSGAPEPAKNRLSLTQSPYYKVLVKGDVMPPKGGRADDFRWPREGALPDG